MELNWQIKQARKQKMLHFHIKPLETAASSECLNPGRCWLGWTPDQALLLYTLSTIWQFYIFTSCFVSRCPLTVHYCPVPVSDRLITEYKVWPLAGVPSLAQLGRGCLNIIPLTLIQSNWSLVSTKTHQPRPQSEQGRGGGHRLYILDI